jgi:hypothetical protein
MQYTTENRTHYVSHKTTQYTSPKNIKRTKIQKFHIFKFSKIINFKSTIHRAGLHIVNQHSAR